MRHRGGRAPFPLRTFGLAVTLVVTLMLASCAQPEAEAPRTDKAGEVLRQGTQRLDGTKPTGGGETGSPSRSGETTKDLSTFPAFPGDATGITVTVFDFQFFPELRITLLTGEGSLYGAQAMLRRNWTWSPVPVFPH